MSVFYISPTYVLDIGTDFLGDKVREVIQFFHPVSNAGPIVVVCERASYLATADYKFTTLSEDQLIEARKTGFSTRHPTPPR